MSFKFWLNIINNVDRDSAVDIVTRYELDDPGFESRWGRDFSHLQTDLGDHPVPCTMGTGSFPGVKRPGRGVDLPPHIAPRSMEQYSHTSTAFWSFMFCSGVNFTLIFISNDTAEDGVYLSKYFQQRRNISSLWKGQPIKILN